MSAQSAAASERLVDLGGRPISEVSSQLIELAGAQGYTVAASGPASYRLARTRRRLVVSKRTESASVSVFSDRNGTKVRVVGELDPIVIEHLVGERTVAGAPPPPTASPQPAPPPPTPAPAPPPPPGPPPAPAVINHETTVHRSHLDELSAVDDRTVARPSPNPAPQPAASLVLPDGRSIALERPVIVGRNPDPAVTSIDPVPVPLADASLSKTHFVVRSEGDRVRITDLHSTNGTSVLVDGRLTACAAGDECIVPASGIVIAGDVEFTIRGIT